MKAVGMTARHLLAACLADERNADSRILTTSDVPLKPLSVSEMAKIANKQSVVRAVEHIYSTDRRHVPLARKYLRQRIHKRPDLLDF